MTEAAFRPSRRQALTAIGALASYAALPGSLRAALAQAPTPEIKKAVFGYIALTDAAPLIIAKEKGFFAAVGMPEVEVSKQASWGTTRDNLELGSASGGIDGAHILTPMPYLMTLGKITKNNQPVPMSILARLNTNGQAISVSKAHAGIGVGLDSSPLKPIFAKMAAGGKEVRCAVTFRGGTHDLWMRYWLAAGGIDPEKDVQTIVVPPPQMVANMKVNSMEAFCVGEPWNAQLVNQGIGFTAMSTGEFWQDHPEKSFAVRSDWAAAHPKAAQAALQAVLTAQQWCDKPENKDEMCQILGRRAWFNVPVDDIVGRSKGMIDYGSGRKVETSPAIMKFWRDHASYPYQSHDLWFLTENMRWGVLPHDLDAKALIAAVNREDLWRVAAAATGVTKDAMPASSSRGPEKFFDGKVFDPADPMAYLSALSIKKVA